MNLIKRNNDEKALASRFIKDFDRLFDDFFLFKPTSLFENKWNPVIDVEEDKKAIHVTAELPGIDEKDLDVTIEKDHLVLSGEKKEEKEEKTENSLYSERTYGSFHRSIALPKGINTEKIKASYKKGVLKIDIPKEGAEEPKKITISH
ncbi:MAG: Hsp20/alpha crystallin family protein [Spirochaetes bacterium]|nr:Hsp20/alpha crystallin family protein [Spirochaetota bacterium]